MSDLSALTEDQIFAAFQEAFPGHDLHQESINFARAIERLCSVSAQPVASKELSDEQIDDLWIHRKDIHGGDLMLQLRDFARAILAASRLDGANAALPSIPGEKP